MTRRWCAKRSRLVASTAAELLPGSSITILSYDRLSGGFETLTGPDPTPDQALIAAQAVDAILPAELYRAAWHGIPPGGRRRNAGSIDRRKRGNRRVRVGPALRARNPFLIRSHDPGTRPPGSPCPAGTGPPGKGAAPAAPRRNAHLLALKPEGHTGRDPKNGP